jgi:pyruvate formate lyase activating enzyme
MDPRAGREIPLPEILDECRRSAPMFFGGGGVTFTGGEATLQHSELLSLLKLLKGEGIHTAIETNGTSGKLFELLPYVDYLIMDFKHFDSERLEEFTSMGNGTVKANFERLCREKRQVHIRIPLIKGFNSEDATGFAKYFSQHDTAPAVFEFLPYHEYGKEKWTEEYRITDGFVSDLCVSEFKKVFNEYGLKTVNT